MKPLSGCSILVTRPQHQANPFCLMLEQAGATVFKFPTLEIKATAPDREMLYALTHLDQQDILLFTSSNAVHFCKPWLDSIARSMPSNLPYKIAAIGKKTAQALMQQHLEVHIFPKQNFNSESLLALPAMQSVKNKKIIIIKGQGGRSLLRKNLQKRGAYVQEADVYSRQRPIPDSLMLNTLKSQKIDIITLTSVESSENLFAMLKNELPAWLATSTLLLGSKRIHQTLYNKDSNDNKNTKHKELTCPFWIAKNPSDNAMLTALLEWKIRMDKPDIERL